ncbi:Acidic phospholipase A2 PA4 [Clonorchis sinensis]|uniref:Acidic phospholipase A2 PA4 n=1 Tax=Clonorchis sinensis TaxID=79923 RepID=A0A3R7JQZ5_CLOSI|nr:Acidic phospholipase A2 PA4 [Clonorchis sinensis]
MNRSQSRSSINFYYPQRKMLSRKEKSKSYFEASLPLGNGSHGNKQNGGLLTRLTFYLLIRLLKCKSPPQIHTLHSSFIRNSMVSIPFHLKSVAPEPKYGISPDENTYQDENFGSSNSGSTTLSWDSKYLIKMNLTDDAQLIVWSLVPNQSTELHGKDNSSGDWIQVDLLRESPQGERISLRLYLDEHRLLRNCLADPDDIGEPVPPETSSISVTQFSIFSVLSTCRLFQAGSFLDKNWLANLTGRIDGNLFSALRMPNTNYCGPNNAAHLNKSLGLARKTDQCCYDHDTCSYNIEPGETKYGIENTRKGTMFHCSCDLQFCGCLKKARTLTAYVVGVTYFSVYQPDCFYFSDGTMKQAIKRPSYNFITQPTCQDPERTETCNKLLVARVAVDQAPVGLLVKFDNRLASVSSPCEEKLSPNQPRTVDISSHDDEAFVRRLPSSVNGLSAN